MIHFNTDAFDYNKKTKTFAHEASMLGLSPINWNSLRRVPVEKEIQLHNIDTGNSMIFTWTDSDMSPENEVGGWNYKSRTGIKLLIIVG